MIIAPQSPLFRGTQQENIAAMQKYLVELSEALSVSLNSLDGGTDSNLPIATKSRLGGIKVGANLSITSDGTLSAAATADHITSQGASNGWTYRKWNSGIAECWRDLSVSTACSTAIESWYRTAELTTTAYPLTFTEAPNLQMTFETFAGTSGLVWSAGTSDSTPKTKPADVYIIRMASATSITGTLHYYAIGKWK